MGSVKAMRSITDKVLLNMPGAVPLRIECLRQVWSWKDDYTEQTSMAIPIKTTSAMSCRFWTHI